MVRIAVVTGIGSYTDEDRERRRQALEGSVAAGTELELFAADSGVPYVESSIEIHLSGLAVARQIVELAAEGFDAAVGTAFLDNGLDAARELVDMPVVGPAKTTLYLAATLANQFGIIMAGGDLAKHAWAQAKLCGVVDRVAGIRTLDVTVDRFFREPAAATSATIATGRELVEEHGAQALVLGCGATSGLTSEISEALGVPVLDPVLVALKHAETLVTLGLSQSKLAYPANPRVERLLFGSDEVG